MRVLDMRLIAVAMLILLTAAMPANCAEEPVPHTLREVDHEVPTCAAIDQVPDDVRPAHSHQRYP